MTVAVLSSVGTVQLLSVWFTILQRVGIRAGRTSLSNEVGMGSSLQDFEFPERIIFPSSFSVMGSNAVNLGTLELQLDCTEVLLGVNSLVSLDL